MRVVNMQILTLGRKNVMKEHRIRILGRRTSAKRVTPQRKLAEMNITIRTTSKYGRIDA